MADLGEPTTYWVCLDCYFTHHGVREDETPPDCEPLSLIPEKAKVTAGLLLKEHAEDCPNRLAGCWDDVECDCERMTFTWSSCDGCGSHLGGSREALTVWIHEPT